VGVFIILNLVASRFAARFGAPTLLATLAIGLAFGNGGRFDFDYNYPSLTLHLSEIALCIIIFTGGFEAHWKSFRPILKQGISLATLGVITTMFVVGALAHWVLDWPWVQALLLGAVVSATDAAAVFSILENSKLKLKTGVREMLELESGANDPMAFFLTLSLSAMLMPSGETVGAFSLAGDFLQTMVVGLGTGFLAGKTDSPIGIAHTAQTGAIPNCPTGLCIDFICGERGFGRQRFFGSIRDGDNPRQLPMGAARHQRTLF
jgi:cell volume regulation protein A